MQHTTIFPKVVVVVAVVVMGKCLICIIRLCYGAKAQELFLLMLLSLLLLCLLLCLLLLLSLLLFLLLVYLSVAKDVNDWIGHNRRLGEEQGHDADTR